MVFPVLFEFEVFPGESPSPELHIRHLTQGLHTRKPARILIIDVATGTLDAPQFRWNSRERLLCRFYNYHRVTLCGLAGAGVVPPFHESVREWNSKHSAIDKVRPPSLLGHRVSLLPLPLFVLFLQKVRIRVFPPLRRDDTEIKKFVRVLVPRKRRPIQIRCWSSRLRL